MRFHTVQLPAVLTVEDITVLRHYVTLDDGTVHFQEEELQRNGNEIESRRTEWQQVNTPHAEPPVIGLIDFCGRPMAIRADGQAYIWGQVEVDLPDAGKALVDMWAPFLQKVPIGGQDNG